MPSRLGQDPLARVDKNDRDICRRGAGRHVAGVLFMARRVCHDEFASICIEKTVRHINGDALLFRLPDHRLAAQNRSLRLVYPRSWNLVVRP